jgi:hypothetical protein
LEIGPPEAENIFWDLLFGAWNFINPEIQLDVNARIG